MFADVFINEIKIFIYKHCLSNLEEKEKKMFSYFKIRHKFENNNVAIKKKKTDYSHVV